MKKEPNTISKKKTSNVLLLVGAILFLLVGAAVFFYPAISNYFAEQRQAAVISAHATAVQEAGDEEIQKQWDEAIEYNENLAGDPVHDPFVWGSGYALPDNYQSVLDLDEVMCSLEIPKIGVYLPVYHGTSEEVLQKGVGHLEMTALPIGGVNRHAVLTGHRGLPSAELFTRLDELQIGDLFYIHVLDEIHAYQVDQIETVEPDDLAKLVPDPEKDLITLVTCTPYAVNSHRLLIRGERVPYEPTEQGGTEVHEAVWNSNLQYYLPGIILGAALVVVLIIVLLRKRRKKEKNHETK